jgi:Mn-dependent DtxR family transcriptional regulator
MHLTPIQKAAHLVIRHRQERGEPGPTLDEIAAAIGVSKPRASTIVARLETLGAVTWPKALGRRIPRWARAVVG